MIKNIIFNSLSRFYGLFTLTFLNFFLSYFIIQNKGFEISSLALLSNNYLIFISLFEFGYTLTSSFFLTKIFLTSDINLIKSTQIGIYNKLISLSNLLFFINLFLSFLIPLFLNLNLSFWYIFIIIFLTGMNYFIQLRYLLKFMVYYSAVEKEFIFNNALNVIQTINLFFSLGLVLFNFDYLFIKLMNLFFTLIAIIHFQSDSLHNKSFYKPIFTNRNVVHSLPKTSELFLQKLISTLIYSLPLFLIGFIYDSQHVVLFSTYSFIFLFISKFVISIILSALNSFSKFYHKEKKDKNIFNFLSLFIIFLTFFFTTVTVINSSSFVNLFTQNKILELVLLYEYLPILFAILIIFEIMSSLFGGFLNSSSFIKINSKYSLFSFLLTLVSFFLLQSISGIYIFPVSLSFFFAIVVFFQVFGIRKYIPNINIYKLVVSILLNFLCFLLLVNLIKFPLIQDLNYLSFLRNISVSFGLSLGVFGFINTTIVIVFKFS